MDPSTLMWGVIFGAFGLGFFVYGKKQKVIMPVVSGIGLMLIPYVISNTMVLVLIGIILIVLAFIIKR
jgi:hypothetical protein